MNYKYYVLFPLVMSCLIISAQTKRALVIGLGLQQDTSWTKINGDKDVPVVIEMLKNAGYDNKNIITLVNKEATKQNIIISFNKLEKQCRLNDIVYIHFSGHGQRITDIDGDEEDGWDESWIPYDAYRKYNIMDQGEKHLVDDEIYKLLLDIKHRIGRNGKILVVVDACHGGDSTMYPMYLDGFSDIKFGTGIAIRGVSDPFVLPHNCNSKIPKNSEQWITLSACKSFQTNQELNNPRVGILSYALYMISRKGSIKMREIEDYIKQNKGPYPQTPVLTGEVDKYNISDILK